MDDVKTSVPSKASMAQLKSYNMLSYGLPSNISTVSKRTNKVNFADNNSYSSLSGNEIVIRLQSSQDYVFGKNSYLIMDVEAISTGPAGDALGFKNNSALSLFSRVLFESKDGQEIERNDNLAGYGAQVVPLHYSAAATKNIHANAGQFNAIDESAPGSYIQNGNVANYDARASPLTVAIKLGDFLGVFNNETLIPSMLLAGSLIRLELNSAKAAFENLTPAGTDDIDSYQITNPRIVVDSMMLMPSIYQNLLEQSQSGGGLDYVYSCVYHQNASTDTTAFNLQVNKAVSRCQRLYWSTHAENTPVSALKNNLGTNLINVVEYDVRVGDCYFPSRPIIVKNGNPVRNGAELYENTLQSIEQQRTNSNPVCITKNLFLTSGTALSATAANNNNDGRAVHCQSFETSSSVQNSGISINNSRTMEARIKFSSMPTTIILDSWISYLKLIKVNPLRAVIKE